MTSGADFFAIPILGIKGEARTIGSRKGGRSNQCESYLTSGFREQVRKSHIQLAFLKFTTFSFFGFWVGRKAEQVIAIRRRIMGFPGALARQRLLLTRKR